MIGNALGGLKDIIAGRISRMARNRAQSAALYALIVFLLLIAVLAALVALGIALAARWGGVVACLSIAGGAVLIALIVLVIVTAKDRAARERERREAALQKQALATILTVAPLLKSRNALLLAVAAGLVAGIATRSPKRDD